MEMSINKTDVMLEKSKVLILKLDSMYIVIPMAVTKIEVKTRNVLLNQKDKFDGLAAFMKFYLQNQFSQQRDKEKGPAEEEKKQE